MSTFNEANEIASYAVFGVGYQGDPDNASSPRPEGAPLTGTLVFTVPSDPSDRYTITLDGKIASHDTWANLASQIERLMLNGYDIQHDQSTAVTGSTRPEIPEMQLRRNNE